MRVKRKNGVVFTIPHDRLQDKSQRYYFHEALKLKPGEIYISPMDLNVEYGEIEKPEQPVIRFATPIPDENGQVQGLLVANLHAQVLLEQVQELTEARARTAYLIDRSGYYLSRSSEPDPQTARPEEAFSMLPLAQLAALYGQPALERMVADAGGTVETGGRIVAHASVDLRAISGVTPAGQWLIAMDFPQSALFFAVAKLSALYAVLLAALATTAVGGFALSRHLLRPLTVLAGETRALAGGDFSRRIAVQGHDEIAALGHQFNTMASRIDELVRSLAAERDRLDDQVRSRTRDLEHERSFLAAVIQHSADGILAVDQGGAITLANAAAIRLLGLNPDPQGQPIVQICTGWPDTAQQAASGVALRRELVVGGNTLALAVQALAPGAGFIIMLRDVTEERRLQDERRELDRQMFQMDKMATLGELAMGLAHEIGNPLAGMKAVAQSLQQHRDMRPAPRTVLARLESEVDRLSTFLQSFHGFAAPQACQPQPCVLAEVLHDVLFWVRKEARTQEVRIVLQGVEGAPRLWADPHQIKQLLLNLFINAAHAMPDGGTLTIAAHAEQGLLRIDIRDTGGGIDAAVLPHIFEPFYTTRREGSGVGLAVVRKIVEEHGARIAVASEVGIGTCFTLHWPTPHE
jgi:signal transduction histidine kinase/HAMP domain-containing protein